MTKNEINKSAAKKSSSQQTNIKFKLLNQKQISEVFERFKKQNANPQTELLAPNPYCLLVSVVLSAQATDKSVNNATRELYKKVKTPQQMVTLGKENLISYIKSIGLFRTKADHVIALSEKLISDFGGKLPCATDKNLSHEQNVERIRSELMSLPGVGRKTANVMLNVVYGEPTMPVDTHLMRICPKIGLAEGKDPLEVEQSLVKRIPPEYMMHAHHWLILHGRYVCVARNPKCNECILNDLCCHNNVK